MTSFINLFIYHSLLKCTVKRTRSLKPTRTISQTAARSVTSVTHNTNTNILQLKQITPGNRKWS